jgi:N-sulfoglucosamine sulfohydrolase
MPNRPNVLLIVWHDLGDWLGCYGHRAIDSPHLDSLAEQGALFEHYFATAPQCSPSRASIITGLMPHTTGVMGLTHLGFQMRMDREFRALPYFFRRAGYSTTLLGTHHELPDLDWAGYDRHIGGRLDQQVNERTAAYVAGQAEAFFASHDPSQPFYLAIGTQDVHRQGPSGGFPIQGEPANSDQIHLPPYLPDEPRVRDDMARLCQHIKEADEHMGRIFAALDAHGLRENTLVIFTSEHGPDYPHMKQTLYDAGLKVPLIMRWPDGIKAGQRFGSLLSSVDFAPTLLDLARIVTSQAFHGRSFANLPTGGPYEPRTEIFAEFTWHNYYQPMRAIRTQDAKYIVNFRPHVPTVIGPAMARVFGPDLLERHYADPLPGEELYDLRVDPHELDNHADDQDYASIRQDLRARLMAWLAATDDPILNGPVPHPKPEQARPDFWTKRGERFVVADDYRHEAGGDNGLEQSI